MSRKDYELIARAMATSKPTGIEPEGEGAEVQWILSCAALATVLGNDNPRFDAERFLDACNNR